MAQKGKTQILILKGLLVFDGREYPKGSTVEVDPTTLERLMCKLSPTFNFSVTKGGIPPKATVKPPEITESMEDTGDDGDDPEQYPSEDQVDEESDQQISTKLGLRSVDAELESRLASAGLDSLEKIQAASVGKLTTIKGVGKLRAEAIKAEVEAL